jgi:carbonic anhydrase
MKDGVETNECAKPGGSPINLTTSAKYDTANDFKFEKTYKNVSSPSTSSPYGTSTNQIQVDSVEQGFTSTYGEKLTAPAAFSANQFHWHAGSEHTVDDVRMDMEMHTVHFPAAPAGG